ncbi:MAG: hypothetical protein IKQ92_08400 [Clostridia bacterium]|nr:hypothetical protein [Clostridia bacterium]
MKNQPAKRTSAPSGKSSAGTPDKRPTVFLFSCIGGILYVVPALSAIFLGVTAEGGMSTGFILGIVALALGIPNSLFAMRAFSKRKYRPPVIAAASALIALHLVCLYMLGTWYVMLSPALILLVLMIVFSSVIENH